MTISHHILEKVAGKMKDIATALEDAVIQAEQRQDPYASATQDPATGQWRYVDRSGYVRLYPEKPTPKNFFRYDYEHRKVMAEKLKRDLAIAEIVHHLDGNRSNNAAENLAIIEDHIAHMRGEHPEWRRGLTGREKTAANREHFNELIKQFKSLGLPVEDTAIFGSGPMAAHGLRDDVHDFDVISRAAAWEKAQQLGQMDVAGSGDPVARFGDIEVFNSWYPGKWDVNALIDAAEKYKKLKFVQLADVLEWKRRMGREKDIADIAAVENYLAKKARQ